MTVEKQQENNPPKKGPHRFGPGPDNPGWKPGKSGNPGGRPRKDKCIPDILRKIGDGKVRDFNILPRKLKDMIIRGLGEDVTVEEARNSLRYLYAMRGDHSANQHIDERVEGKVASAVRLSFSIEEVQAKLNDLMTSEPLQEDIDVETDSPPDGGGADGGTADTGRAAD